MILTREARKWSLLSNKISIRFQLCFSIPFISELFFFNFQELKWLFLRVVVEIRVEKSREATDEEASHHYVQLTWRLLI